MHPIRNRTKRQVGLLHRKLYRGTGRAPRVSHDHRHTARPNYFYLSHGSAPLLTMVCEFEFTELFDPISESESVELGPSADGGGGDQG
jgi:hypothetical protein